MNENFTNLNESFEKYFNELEGYHLRSERFYEELRSMTPERMVEWLRAAFIEGAKCAANDTLNLVHHRLYLDYHDFEEQVEPILNELKEDILENYEITFLACDGVDTHSKP